MRWVRSTTSKAWTAGGKVIPSFSDRKPEFLAIEDNEWEKIASLPVIAALIRHGDIYVTDEAPAQLVNDAQVVTSELAQLRMKNSELQEKLKATQAQLDANGQSTANNEAYEKLKAEAIQELKEMQAKLDAANAEVAALKKASKSKAKTEPETNTEA